MTRLLTTLLALTAAVACSAAARSETTETPVNTAESAEIPAPEAEAFVAPASDARADGAIHCEVRATNTANGVQLDAIVHSGRGASGEYDLIITKSGASGSGDIVQGGEFSVAAGETAVLGAAEFSMERGDRFHARLMLRDSDGELCGDNLRS